jgi:stearoyl-CoA desaturase (delta-9 desaturase)
MNAVYALLLAAVAVQLSTFATSIYLHRGLTHRALAIHPLAAFPFRLQLWVATGIVPKEWVAVHRKHHRFADQEGDPHSPVLKGLWKILLGNVFYYARETRNPETLRDRVHRVAGSLVGWSGLCRPDGCLRLPQRGH